MQYKVVLSLWVKTDFNAVSMQPNHDAKKLVQCQMDDRCPIKDKNLKIDFQKPEEQLDYLNIKKV